MNLMHYILIAVFTVSSAQCKFGRRGASNKTSSGQVGESQFIDVSEVSNNDNKFLLVETCADLVCVTDYHPYGKYQLPNINDNQNSNVKVQVCEFDSLLPSLEASQCKVLEDKKDFALTSERSIDAIDMKVYPLRSSLSEIADTLMTFSSLLVKQNKVCSQSDLEKNNIFPVAPDLKDDFDREFAIAVWRVENPKRFYHSLLNPGSTEKKPSFNLLAEGDAVIDIDALSETGEVNSDNRASSSHTVIDIDALYPQPGEEIDPNRLPAERIEPDFFGRVNSHTVAGIDPDQRYLIEVTHYRPSVDAEFNVADLAKVVRNAFYYDKTPADWLDESRRNVLRVVDGGLAIEANVEKIASSIYKYAQSRGTPTDVFRAGSETSVEVAKIIGNSFIIKKASATEGSIVATAYEGVVSTTEKNAVRDLEIRTARVNDPALGHILGPTRVDGYMSRIMGSAKKAAVFMGDTLPKTIDKKKVGVNVGPVFDEGYEVLANLSGRRGSQFKQPKISITDLGSNFLTATVQQKKTAYATAILQGTEFLVDTGRVLLVGQDTLVWDVYRMEGDIRTPKKVGLPVHSLSYPASHEIPGTGDKAQVKAAGYKDKHAKKLLRNFDMSGESFIDILTDMKKNVRYVKSSSILNFQSSRAQISIGQSYLTNFLATKYFQADVRNNEDVLKNIGSLINDATWESKHVFDAVPRDIYRLQDFAIYNFKVALLESLRKGSASEYSSLLREVGYSPQMPRNINEMVSFDKQLNTVIDQLLRLNLDIRVEDSNFAAVKILQRIGDIQGEPTFYTSLQNLVQLRENMLGSYYDFASTRALQYNEIEDFKGTARCSGFVCGGVEGLIKRNGLFGQRLQQSLEERTQNTLELFKQMEQENQSSWNARYPGEEIPDIYKVQPVEEALSIFNLETKGHLLEGTVDIGRFTAKVTTPFGGFIDIYRGGEALKIPIGRIPSTETLATTVRPRDLEIPVNRIPGSAESIIPTTPRRVYNPDVRSPDTSGLRQRKIARSFNIVNSDNGVKGICGLNPTDIVYNLSYLNTYSQYLRSVLKTLEIQ